MNLQVDPDWWKTLFDELYLVTDARSVCSDDITCREVEIIENLLPLKPNDKILDFCGGQGRHSIELSRRGFSKCTVFDYSNALLEIGKENAKRNNFQIEFIQGDARNTQLSSNRFHHVLILGNSLGYIPDKDADLLILNESYRLLKYRGWLLIDVGNGKAVLDNFTPSAWHEIEEDVVVCRQREIQGEYICSREMVLSKQRGLMRDRTYSIRLFTPKSLEMLVRNPGFQDINVYTDFSPHQCKGDLGFMNHRMILTAQKQ